MMWILDTQTHLSLSQPGQIYNIFQSDEAHEVLDTDSSVTPTQPAALERSRRLFVF